MSQTIETIMDRIKNLSIFDITIEMPPLFSFNGVVPFDVTIKGNIATFKVCAVDITEAKLKLDNYVSTLG